MFALSNLIKELSTAAVFALAMVTKRQYVDVVAKCQEDIKAADMDTKDIQDGDTGHAVATYLNIRNVFVPIPHTTNLHSD